MVTPTGRHRVPPPARLRRRPVARPPLARLRGHPRRDHRGVDAGAGPAARSGPRPSVRFDHLRRRRRRRPGPGPVRALPGQLPAARPGRGPLRGAWRPPVLLSASSRPTTPSTPRWHRALECCADHGGTAAATAGCGSADGRRRRDRRPTGRHGGAVAHGRSCGRPTCATDGRAGRHRRDVRDRRHVGPLRRPPRAVKAAVREALSAVGAPGGFVSCRFTHVYPDGPAPYYTVIAPGRRATSSSSGRR